METVLVTGSAGFIGWRTAELLLKRGIRVVGIDNLNDAYDPKMKFYRLERLRRVDSFDFYQIDVAHQEEVRQVCQQYRFDVIIHLAARAGVRYSLSNPEEYIRTNTIGTLNLLTVMKDLGIPKMVLASTSSLYAGQVPPFREDLPIERPLSPYAASKRAAELMGYTYHHLYGLDVIVLRYFTVYGPAGRPDMSIFRFIKWIDEESPIQIFGDGAQARDFTYVDDIVRGTLKACELQGYEVINLGSGKVPVSLQDTIRMVEKLLGKRAQIQYHPFHKADLMVTQADIMKAQQMMGWTPEIDFEEGLSRTVQWYVENKHWVRNVRVD